MATASADGWAQALDATAGAELTSFKHRGWVVAVTLSMDETRIATAGADSAPGGNR